MVRYYRDDSEEEAKIPYGYGPFRLRIRAEGLDEVNSQIRRLAALCPDAARSALKSSAWMLHVLLKEYGRSGVAMLGWPQLDPHTGRLNQASAYWGLRSEFAPIWERRRREVGQKYYGRGKNRKRMMHVTSVRRAPLAKLVNAIRYRVAPNSKFAFHVGFLSRSGRLAAIKQAQGIESEVTDRMRRFLFAVGMPVYKSTRIITSRPRPLVGPVWSRHQGEIIEHFKNEFAGILSGAGFMSGDPFGSQSTYWAAAHKARGTEWTG